MALVDTEPRRGALRGDGPGDRDLRWVGGEHDGGHRVVRRARRVHRPGRTTTSSARSSPTTCAPPACSFDTPPRHDGLPTGRCLIVVTPDAERTMNTYPRRVRRARTRATSTATLVASRAGHLPRGLPLGPARRQGAFRRAARARARRRPPGRAHAVGPVLRRAAPRRRSSSWSQHEVDILFANEAEICSLYEVDDFDARAPAGHAAHCEIAALTRSAKGSVDRPRRRGARRSTRTRSPAASSTPPAPATSTPPGSSRAHPRLRPRRRAGGSARSRRPR